MSKPSVTVARWSAERIGPTIIAAPQRGQAHVARVAGSVAWRRGRVGGRVPALTAWRAACARARSRAARQVFARNPDCRMRTKPRGRMCWTKRRRNSMADERHRAALVAMGVVLPVEGDVVAIEGEQPVIADRDAMGVAPEIAQDGGRAPEGRLGVDDPVGLEERVDEGAPLRRVTQVLAATGEVEFVLVVRAAERLDKLPAKDATEDLHGQEEAGVLRMDPPLMIRREATRGHDAVDVRMADQRLPPRVEDAQHADLRAEMARVGGDLAERGRARLEEPGVQARTIPIGQRQQRMRQREDDVHIRHVEQLPLARVQPALARLRLALRAVPVPTRVIGDGLMAAGVTPIEMAAEGRRATARDRAEDRSLLRAQPRMLLEEGVTLRVEDIGHLHGRPAHDAGGFRSSRDRVEDHRRRHLQLLERIRRRLQVAPREVQIDRRVREVGVAQQHLDRPQVGAGLQEMRRVRCVAACAG